MGLLDTEAFWDPLVALLDRLDTEGFLRGTPRDWLVRDDDPERLLTRLESFAPPVVRRWVRLSET